MNIEHQATLTRVFDQPTPDDLRWDELEAMLREAGVKVTSRTDSRVALVKLGHAMVVQRPHPRPLTVRATVRDLAAFLKTVGVTP